MSLVKTMLARGANVSLGDDAGDTALHIAAELPDIEVVFK